MALSVCTRLTPSRAEVGHDQSLQFLAAQCLAEAQLQQQISQMWRVVADFEAWQQYTLCQMDELRRENAELKRKWSNVPGDDLHGEQDHHNKLPSFIVSQHRMPPGLVLDAEPKENVELKVASLAPPANVISISTSSVDGKPTSKVQWRINRISAQLYTAMGRALVSPEFDMGGISGTRLMIAPNISGDSAPKGKRAKEVHKKLMTEGPLDARLMLKVPNAPDESVEYYATVGDQRRGPFATNFSVQCLVTHSDFGIDWLQERESDGSLVVCVEILPPDDSEIVDLCDE